jgi:hypothetical protein
MRTRNSVPHFGLPREMAATPLTGVAGQSNNDYQTENQSMENDSELLIGLGGTELDDALRGASRLSLGTTPVI